MHPPLYSAPVQLQRQDFFLFRQEFARELEKILPVSATPFFWAADGQDRLPAVEGMAPPEVAQQLETICAAGEPGRVRDLLVLPLPLANGGQQGVILQGIDPGLSQKMAQEWLASISDQLRTSLELVKLAHVHPETGLYSSRLLHSRLTLIPVGPSAFFLVGATYRSGMPTTRLRQLVQTARLLETTVAGAVYYLGGSLFGFLQEGLGREGALHTARRLLGRLKREGLRTAHIGIAIRGDGSAASGPWFAECWQALETAERRGPYSLCESSALRNQPAHPFARPAPEVIRQLRRSWRGLERFGLLLCRMEMGGAAAPLAGLLDGHQVFVPVSQAEAYILLPGASPPEALRQARALKKRGERLGGNGGMALGISTWPCLNYTRAETAVNCRKALLHGRFFGPGAVTVFDHVSLNVSGDYCFDEGDYRQAVRDFQAGLLLNPGDVNLMNSLGVTLAELNRQQLAIGAFDRVLAREPGNLMALANKGFALRMLGRHAEALACFKEAARQPGFSRSEAFADISLQLGRLFCTAGRYREALPVLERLEKSSAEQQGFHLYALLGEAYAGVGKHALAMPVLQRAIRHNPHDAQSLSILGELYAREEEGDDIAHSFCLQALALDDRPARYWYRLAWVREKMGATESALAAVQEALRRDRRDAESLRLAARLYRTLGLEKKARAMKRRAEKKDIPGHREGRRPSPSPGTRKPNRKG